MSSTKQIFKKYEGDLMDFTYAIMGTILFLCTFGILSIAYEWGYEHNSFVNRRRLKKLLLKKQLKLIKSMNDDTNVTTYRCEKYGFKICIIEKEQIFYVDDDTLWTPITAVCRTKREDLFSLSIIRLLNKYENVVVEGKDRIVSLELAKLISDFGAEIPSKMVYDRNCKHDNGNDGWGYMPIKDYPGRSDSRYVSCYAPLLDDVEKWLIKNYNTYIDINPFGEFSNYYKATITSYSEIDTVNVTWYPWDGDLNPMRFSRDTTLEIAMRIAIKLIQEGEICESNKK